MEAQVPAIWVAFSAFCCVHYIATGDFHEDHFPLGVFWGVFGFAVVAYLIAFGVLLFRNRKK